MPAALLVLFLVCIAWPVQAQDEEVPSVTRTIAIQDARIVQAPGQVLEQGTVVFHRGVVTDVGADVAIPYDAKIIDGGGLTVYAGLVDGLSHAAVPDRDGDSDQDDDVSRADPPDDFAGIQPERDVRDLLDPADESVDGLRRAGVTTAHVVPRGRMLPGRGSIVLLTGQDPGEMVLRPDVSLFFQFRGGPGVYPATPMGVMATMRQLVREAERRRQIEGMYEENPSGMQRPPLDPVHRALYPVLAGSMPVYSLTDGDDSALEVHRALRLRDELGFQVVLAGLHRGFDVVDALAEEEIPLFLTLDLPEKPDTAATDTAEAEPIQAEPAVSGEEQPSTFFVSDLRTRTYEDVDREETNLVARQALAREEYYGTAARFYEAGLRFGITTIGVEPDDIRKNVQRIIEAGLPEEAALAALTIDGARLLGIDRIVGTVETGKLANLIIVEGSYFNPDDPVRYVFVDGNMYEYTSDS